MKQRGKITITELDSDTCEAYAATAHWIHGPDEQDREQIVLVSVGTENRSISVRDTLDIFVAALAPKE